MSGLNKKRFTIWGIIFAVFLIIGGGGFALNYAGHGQSGIVRKEVGDLVKKFNALSGVASINSVAGQNMRADLTDSGIKVTYQTADATYKVDFDYEVINTTKVLTTTYKDSQKAVETIVEKMIEAVSVNNGNAEGKVFEKFQYINFYETTINQGVQLRISGTSVKVTININANILSAASGDEEQVEDNYVIINDSTKSFGEYATYTLPEGFAEGSNGYQKTTENNTCTAMFNIVSVQTEKDALSVANLIAKGEKTTASTEEINGKTWNKVSYTSSQGGTNTVYLIDHNGLILKYEYQSMYENNECDNYASSIIKSLKLK